MDIIEQLQVLVDESADVVLFMEDAQSIYQLEVAHLDRIFNGFADIGRPLRYQLLENGI